jgi:hypothetical protein
MYSSSPFLPVGRAFLPARRAPFHGFSGLTVFISNGVERRPFQLFPLTGRVLIFRIAELRFEHMPSVSL